MDSAYPTVVLRGVTWKQGVPRGTRVTYLTSWRANPPVEAIVALPTQNKNTIEKFGMWEIPVTR